jgi:hypothetical protein
LTKVLKFGTEAKHFSPQKRTSSTSKQNFFTHFIFVDHFFPLLDLDPAPQRWTFFFIIWALNYICVFHPSGAPGVKATSSDFSNST